MTFAWLNNRSGFMLPLKSTGHSGSALEPSSHLEAITSSRTTVKGNEILAAIEDLVDKI